MIIAGGSTRLPHYATWAAYASAVGVAGDLAVSVLFFTQGWIKPGPRSHSVFIESLDVLSALLVLVLALALYELFRRTAATPARAVLLLGIGGGLYVAVLHALFVLEVLWFSDAVLAFLLGLLFYAIWILGIGYYLGKEHHMRHSLLFSILGATAIGYPIWAIWLGRAFGRMTIELDGKRVLAGE